MLLYFLPNVGYGYHSYLFICFLSNPLYLHGSSYCMYIWIKFTCCATVGSLELCHLNSFLLWLKYTKLLYKDNEAWHFLEIPENGSSLKFHQKLCYKFSTENSVEICLFIIKPKFLGKRARKLTSKKKKKFPWDPFSLERMLPLSPEASLRKLREMVHVIFPGNSHVSGLFIHFCVEFYF